MDRPIERHIYQYVHETLGINLEPRPWSLAADLPYYLQDALEWYEAVFLERQVLIVYSPQVDGVSLSDIRNKVNKVRSMTGLPIMYATLALASYQRRYLIENKIPFIVPGNQLYLPDLGIDLREHFRKQAIQLPEKLSPAAQAVLIKMLLTADSKDSWTSAGIAQDLKYSAMTLSRAMRELQSAELVAIRGERRGKVVCLGADPAKIWTRAMELMRTPVKSRLRVSNIPNRIEEIAPLAGINALSRTTMLAEPMNQTRAISTDAWNSIRRDEVPMAPEWDKTAIELEVWRYDPTLGEYRSVVDPLSLTLSLRDHNDERVQLALEELEGQYPWSKD